VVEVEDVSVGHVRYSWRLTLGDERNGNDDKL